MTEPSEELHPLSLIIRWVNLQKSKFLRPFSPSINVSERICLPFLSHKIGLIFISSFSLNKNTILLSCERHDPGIERSNCRIPCHSLTTSLTCRSKTNANYIQHGTRSINTCIASASNFPAKRFTEAVPNALQSNISVLLFMIPLFGVNFFVSGPREQFFHQLVDIELSPFVILLCLFQYKVKLGGKGTTRKSWWVCATHFLKPCTI